MKTLSAVRIAHKGLLNLVICCINFYRHYLSGLVMPRCRFYPTCSAYAYEAFKKRGLLQGLGLTIRRLVRCHPYSRAHFFDPVEKSVE